MGILSACVHEVIKTDSWYPPWAFMLLWSYQMQWQPCLLNPTTCKCPKPGKMRPSPLGLSRNAALALLYLGAPLVLLLNSSSLLVDDWCHWRHQCHEIMIMNIHFLGRFRQLTFLDLACHTIRMAHMISYSRLHACDYVSQNVASPRVGRPRICSNFPTKTKIIWGCYLSNLRWFARCKITYWAHADANWLLLWNTPGIQAWHGHGSSI